MEDEQLVERRILRAERSLTFLLADVEKWVEQDRIEAGAAVDARGAVTEALQWLAGDRDGHLDHA